MSSRDVTSTSNSKFLIEVKSSQVPKFLNFKPIEKSGIWTSSSVSDAICMDMTAELIAGKQPLAERKRLTPPECDHLIQIASKHYTQMVITRAKTFPVILGCLIGTCLLIKAFIWAPVDEYEEHFRAIRMYFVTALMAVMLTPILYAASRRKRYFCSNSVRQLFNIISEL